MIRYATFGQRTWALILDLLLDLTALALLSVAATGAELAGLFGFWYVLHHVGLVTEGGTFGHRLLGQRIVRGDGRRVGVPHALLREVGRVFLSLPPLGLGFLWMLDHRERRCWHDIIGDTVVVHERVAAASDAPAWAEAPPWRKGAHVAGMPQPTPETAAATIGGDPTQLAASGAGSASGPFVEPTSRRGRHHAATTPAAGAPGALPSSVTPPGATPPSPSTPSTPSPSTPGPVPDPTSGPAPGPTPSPPGTTAGDAPSPDDT